MPKHSIIMPAYNSSKTIEASIESVLCQTEKDHELIIVDDCSTDDIGSIYEVYSSHPKVKLIHMPKNVGPGDCRNKGIEVASGRYIHFLDSDDLYLPMYLSSIGKMHEETGSSLCCAAYIRVGSFKRKLSYASITCPPSAITGKMIGLYNAIPLLTSSVDRAVLTLPKFENQNKARLSRPEDYIFWLNIFTNNEGLVASTCAQPLAIYNVIPHSRSYNKYATIKRIYEINHQDRNDKLRSTIKSLLWAGMAVKGKSLLEIAAHLLP